VNVRLHGNHAFLLPALLETDNIRFEFGGRNLHVKRTTILAALLSTALLIPGCGDPAIGKLQTITLSAQASSTTGGFYNLVGEGGTLQLVATGVYTTKTLVDLTNKVTYNVTIAPPGQTLANGALQLPPQTATLNSTGLMTAVPTFVCTWTNEGTDTQPSYFLTGSYQVTATYNGVTSQPIFVAVASAAGDGPNDACGP